MELVTGRTGTPHITSQQDRQLHQGIWGDEAYILNTGNMLEPEVQSSNKILIKDGALMYQGALFSVKVGTTDEVTINNGNQGMKRKDLVAVRYKYDSAQNIETGEWVVIQGTPAESNPVAPSGTSGNIQNGDATVDCPVFIVNLDGINVTGVDIIPEVVPDIPTLNADLSNISANSVIESGGDATNGFYRKWADGTLEMWGCRESQIPISKQVGSIYQSNQFTQNFPIESLTNPVVLLTIMAGGAIWGGLYGRSKTSFSYTLMSAVSWTLAAFIRSWYARGTWK